MMSARTRQDTLYLALWLVWCAFLVGAFLYMALAEAASVGNLP